MRQGVPLGGAVPGAVLIISNERRKAFAMPKLMLDLDRLVVESFETVEGVRVAGTVHANETLESECRCDTASCNCGSVESCTYCGCDTPGYTCEDRCFPQPVTVVNGVIVGNG